MGEATAMFGGAGTMQREQLIKSLSTRRCGPPLDRRGRAFVGERWLACSHCGLCPCFLRGVKVLVFGFTHPPT